MPERPHKVVIEAPAKLNLALDVTGVTGNGYHTVDMVMQAVSLYERVEVVRSMGYSLRLPGSPVPANDKNTATKAASAFFYETGLLAGADITIHKKVPTRAGLAGGSADAAAVLMGLNALYGARLSLAELCAIGATIGADVPFSITGGTARVRGIGEDLTPLPPLPGCWFVIAMPTGFGVSTPAAYAKYDVLGSPVHPDVDAACAAIQQGGIDKLLPHMQNALAHANNGKAGKKLVSLLLGHRAQAALMTGSGAAVFGLFLEEGPARAAAKALRPEAAKVFVVQPVAHGPRVMAQG